MDSNTPDAAGQPAILRMTPGRRAALQPRSLSMERAQALNAQARDAANAVFEAHPSRDLPLCQQCIFAGGKSGLGDIGLGCDHPTMPVNPVSGEPALSCAEARAAEPGSVAVILVLARGTNLCGPDARLFQPMAYGDDPPQVTGPVVPAQPKPEPRV